MSSPENYPFFTLVKNQCQAEAVLAAIECFAEKAESFHLKPRAIKLKRDYLYADGGICLANKVNTLLAHYIESFGELSDQLVIFISKGLQQDSK
ncbi:hypothetical protein ACU6U9_11285 [Pseudomonas sp. HK3]|jgi:hypothetical protein